MSNTSPHHRLATGPERETESKRINLPGWLQAVRYCSLFLIFALLLVFIQPGVGTAESRVMYLIAFALAFINPVWGIYAIALMGPLYLLDQAKTHLLGGLEVLVLGMIGAELRLWNRPAPSMAISRLEITEREHSPMKVYWGLWPHALAGLALMILASSLIGLKHLAFQEQVPEGIIERVTQVVRYTMYMFATEYSWTTKSLFNWLTAMVIAVVAARRMDLIAAARFLKIGGFSLLVACGLALLSWADLLSLEHIRRTNPDPLQEGRLQGLAGHPGWFGQWIVLMWPGLLLWWSPGRTKRNLIIGASVAFVLLALVLTAARAAWLGVIAGTCAGVFFLVYTYPSVKRYLWVALAAGLAVVLLGVLAGGDVLQTRLANLLRVQDRLNYYVSGLIFLREHPLGLGLGTHFRYYEWTFLPSWQFYQFDHVTAHSQWLHTLIENGPLVPLMLFAMVLGMVLEVRKSLPRFEPESRPIVAALSISLLGIFALSVAQYISYIRVVELTVWIMGGVLVGLCRRNRALYRAEEATLHSSRGPRLLLLCGIGALVMASVNAGRTEVGALPWFIGRNDQGGHDFWIGREWKTVIGSDVERVSFSLYRKGLDGEVWISVPGKDDVVYTMKPEEYKWFDFALEPTEEEPFAPPRWLKIRVAPTWTPARWEEDNNDDRGLGVYIVDLRTESINDPEEENPGDS